MKTERYPSIDDLYDELKDINLLSEDDFISKEEFLKRHTAPKVPHSLTDSLTDARNED